MLNDYQRHSQLVDEKFLRGLTNDEADELAQINIALDAAEEAWYAPTKAMLRRLYNKKVQADLESGAAIEDVGQTE